MHPGSALPNMMLTLARSVDWTVSFLLLLLCFLNAFGLWTQAMEVMSGACTFAFNSLASTFMHACLCICCNALCLVQIKGNAPIQIGTYATVIGGLLGVGLLAYLGLKL